MKKRLKKISVILTAALIISSIPGSVFAAEPVPDVMEAELAEAPTEEMPAEETPAEETPAEESPAEEEHSEEAATNSEADEESAPAGNESEEEQNEGAADGFNAAENPAPGEAQVNPGEEETADGNGEQNPDNGESSPSDNNPEDNIEIIDEGLIEEGITGTVSDDLIDDMVSENAAEEISISDNSVSENELESLSENEVSENEIEEEGDIDENYVDYGGNIDMFMDFDEETIEDVAETSEAKLASLESLGDGEAGLNAVGMLDKTYYGSTKYIESLNPTYDSLDVSSNRLCWAYTAADLAEINMTKNGLRNKGDARISPEQIAQTTYNKERYDNYGETWNKTSANPVFDPSSNYRDYTCFLDSNGQPIDVTNENSLKTASGNLLFATFNFERWASPATAINSGSNIGEIEGAGFGFEGNTDNIEAELQNAVWVPNTDLDSIKALIMEYGAAGIQMRKTVPVSGGRTETTIKDGSNEVVTDLGDVKKYSYVPEYKSYSANHTVALVGWNDNIEPSNFRTWTVGGQQKKVSNTGAFLAKSAYVSGETSDNGYFWISYDDAAFKEYNGSYRYAVAYDFVSNKANDYSYGYDGTNYFNSYNTKRVYGIFKSGHSGNTGSGKVEMLKSVGVGVQDAGRYKLTIYTGYDPSGKSQYLNRFEAETMEFELEYPGYHTVELDEPIIFFKDDIISVCFEKSDATNFHMLVDGFPDKNKQNNQKAGHISSNGCAQRTENNVRFNCYTHSTRETAEAYFATASNSTVVSSNWIPYNSGEYMGLTPRMRLYTSEITMPKSLDQTMLDIKLKKYVWTHTGKAITPIPEVLINFNKTENTGRLDDFGRPMDRGGTHYDCGLVMYNKISNGTTDIESHYNYVGVNNTDAGIAAVIVRGKGDVFSGEISVPFKITKEQINIDKCKILGLETQNFQELEGRTLNKVYEDIKDNLIIKYYLPETKHYVTLTRGVDYTIGSIEGENKAGKKLTVMVTGIGSFKNTVKPKFKLRKAKDKKPLSDATVKVDLKMTVNKKEYHWEEGTLPEIEYTGKKIMPEIDKIYDSETGKELVAGVDYNAKVKYKNCKTAGMASIEIKAQKGGLYSGKITRYFLITPLHVTTDAKVKFGGTYKYTGNKIKATPKVTLYNKRMKKSDMYVEYKNNTGSSSGSVTAQGIVFGKGRYIGYMGYGNFTISPSGS